MQYCSAISIERAFRKLPSSQDLALAANIPAANLPDQTETWGDRRGAYRLLDNPEVTFDAVAG